MANPPVVNVASVRHLSPFRYPGGKTWLVPYVTQWIGQQQNRAALFIEPFAGGSIVGLTVAMDQLADHVVLIERDDDVAAVWRTIFGRDYLWLIDQIRGFQMMRDSVVQALKPHAMSRRERAFQTILRNRAQRGGILAPGASLMLKGEGGRGVASRWYPETLANRIKALHQIRGRITFIHGDALELIPRYADRNDALWFVDPPYTAGGKRAGGRLYKHANINHEHLFASIASIRGAALLTYDDAAEVRDLAGMYGLTFDCVPMKNTHHNILHELVIRKQANQTSAQSRRALVRHFRRALSSARHDSIIDKPLPGLFLGLD